MSTVEFPGLGLTFHLNRVAFQIGNLTVTWYGILITVGILLAIAFAMSQCKKFGIIPDKLIDVTLGGVVGGIVGARLYYVAFSWDSFKDDLSSIFKTWEGGMAIYGGLIGAILVGALIVKLRKMKLLPVLDVACMGFLIGQAIGRWGNFVNVEAFGSNTSLPWGMTGERITSYLSNSANVEALNKLGVTVDSLAPVHPCFLYESLWCVLGFVLLFLYSKHRKFDGELFLMYTAWYGVGRGVIEGLRTDSLLLGSIRVSQLLAFVLAAAAVIIWLVVRSKIKRAHDENYLKLYVATEAYQQEVAAYEEKQAQKKNKKIKKKKGEAAPTGENTVGESIADEPAAPVEEPLMESSQTDNSQIGEETSPEADVDPTEASAGDTGATGKTEEDKIDE